MSWSAITCPGTARRCAAWRRRGWRAGWLGSLSLVLLVILQEIDPVAARVQCAQGWSGPLRFRGESQHVERPVDPSRIPGAARCRPASSAREGDATSTRSRESLHRAFPPHLHHSEDCLCCVEDAPGPAATVCSTAQAQTPALFVDNSWEAYGQGYDRRCRLERGGCTPHERAGRVHRRRRTPRRPRSRSRPPALTT